MKLQKFSTTLNNFNNSLNMADQSVNQSVDTEVVNTVSSVDMTVTLPISTSDIGALIGHSGSALNNHVIKKSGNIYTRDGAHANQTNLGIRVQIESKDSKVVASITAVSQELCDIIAENLEKHVDITMKKLTAPKVYKFIFKTNMDSGSHGTGKYIGARGKNIIGTKACCTEALREANVDVSSIRLGVEDDRFLHKNSFNKMFFIKSSATTDNKVLISFSAIYPGNPYDIFKVIKPIIIDSVTNMYPKPKEESAEPELDFLCGHKTQDPVSSTAVKSLEDDNGCYDPTSSSTNSSPRYSPESPRLDDGLSGYGPDA